MPINRATTSVAGTNENINDVESNLAVIFAALNQLGGDLTGSIDDATLAGIAATTLPFGSGISFESTAPSSGVMYVNYRHATGRLIDTSLPGWAIKLNSATDRLEFHRAAATTGSPTFSAVGYITAAGVLLGITATPADASVTVAKTGTGTSGLALGSFSAYRSSAASYSTGAEVVFNTEEWDVSSWYSTSTGRFTPQVAGYYRLNASVDMSAIFTADKYCAVQIVKNGVTHKNFPPSVKRGSSYPLSGGTALVVANGSTDYFSIKIEHDVGGSVAVDTGVAETYFQGELVGKS